METFHKVALKFDYNLIEERYKKAELSN